MQDDFKILKMGWYEKEWTWKGFLFEQVRRDLVQKYRTTQRVVKKMDEHDKRITALKKGNLGD